MRRLKQKAATRSEVQKQGRFQLCVAGVRKGTGQISRALDIPIKHKRRLLGRTIGKLYRIEQGLSERLGLEI
jgi:hypothetical protein